jgi:hypothetical protein
MTAPELTANEREAIEKQLGQASAVISFYLAPPLQPASLTACERALQFIFSRELAANTLSWLEQEEVREASQKLRAFHAAFHFLVARARLVTLLPEGWDIVVSDFTFEGLQETPLLRTEFHKLSGETFVVAGRDSAIFNLIDHFLLRIDEMAGFDPGRRWLSQNRERLLDLRSRFDKILTATRDDSH